MIRPALALAATLLGGCAMLPSLAPTAVPPAVARFAAPTFELAGRLSASDGTHAASGSLEWEHKRAADRWTVYTPLGQIAARLDSTPDGAELLTANGERRQAASADAMLPELLGIEVPMTRLGRWVQGAPAADAEVRAVDGAGRPALVIDQGWRIDYLEYHGDGADALPRRLEVSRGDARLRLVIDHWTLAP